MSSPLKHLTSILVLVLVALALAHAATQKYQERQAAFRKECQQQMQQMGLTKEQAKIKYPTPELGLFLASSVPAGASGEIVFNGRFTPGSKVFIENDAFAVVSENLTATQYKATVRAAADVGPVRASVSVISPVSGISARQYNAVRIAGKFEWTIQAANGWKITARPAPATGRGDSDEAWQLDFYRANETTPFEKPTGRLNFSQSDVPYYTLQVDSQATGGAMGDYQALMQKFSDPKLPAAEREKLMAQLEAMSKKMSDPNYMKQMVADQQKRQQEFGCDNIELKAAGGGAFTGTMRCSEKVGRRIELKATLALAK